MKDKSLLSMPLLLPQQVEDKITTLSNWFKMIVSLQLPWVLHTECQCVPRKLYEKCNLRKGLSKWAGYREILLSSLTR